MRDQVDLDSRWKQTTNAIRGNDSEIIEGITFASLMALDPASQERAGGNSQMCSGTIQCENNKNSSDRKRREKNRSGIAWLN